MARRKKQNLQSTHSVSNIGTVLLHILPKFFLIIGDITIFIFLNIFFFIKKGFSFLRKQVQNLSLQVFTRTKEKSKVIYRDNAPKFDNFLLTRNFIKFASKFLSLRPRFRLRPFPKTLLWFFAGIIFCLLLVFIPYNIYLFLKYLPNPQLLDHRFIPITTQIFDRNGNLLYEIHGDQDRKPVPLSQIPLHVQQATIAIEDKDFYRHNGFSVRGMLRATKETLLNKNLQGGSTITQQLVKNSLLTSEISLFRKLREVALAFMAERIYTKDQILEMYLNQVPYGGTAWGIEAASQRYFGKSVKDLTLSESSLLAGLPAAPTLYSAYGSHPEFAKIRQAEVLRAMIASGYITQSEADNARAIALDIKPYVENIRAPHFVMMVRELLTKKYGQLLVDQGGLRVKTTLDINIQDKVSEIVSRNISELKKLRVGNGAAMVTDPKNGDIIAMVGSKDYFNQAEDGNVNVTLALQQPGSSIKVVTYAAALENELTALSFINDSPISYRLPNQPAYSPVNYDGRFHGTVTLRSALANSYNIPAVKLLDKIGIKTMIDMGRKMGIDTWNDESRFGLSLTLGGGDVTVWDMAEVYGTLANKGERVDLDPILEITDYTGREYYKKETVSTKATSAEISFIISDILADNQARSAAFGPNSLLKIPDRTVSVKTGTTNEKRDNWTIGYTPSYVVAVWVGNNDNSPMDPYLTSGVTGASPIWNQTMQELLKTKADEPMPKPNGIVSMTCFGKTEYFVKGTEPKACPRFPTPSTTPFPTPPFPNP